MKKNNINYLLVGILVISMLTLLGAVLLNISGRTQNTDSYYVLLSQIAGINEGSTVSYGGYQIGQIESIAPVRKNNKTFFKLELSILQGWSIPIDSTASIISPGMLSDSQIDIQEGTSQQFLKPGDTIKGKETITAMVLLNNVASEIVDLSENSVKPLIESIQRQVEQTGDKVNNQLDSISARLLSLLENFQENSRQLTKLFGGENQQHLTNLLKNADQTSQELLDLSKGFDSASRDLTTLLQESGQLLKENNTDIRQTVIDLRNTMSTISTNIHTIVDNLETSSRNMSEFSRRIRENPATILNDKPLVDDAEKQL